LIAWSRAFAVAVDRPNASLQSQISGDRWSDDIRLSLAYFANNAPSTKLVSWRTGRSQVNDEELIVPFVCPQCGEKMVGPSGKTEFQQRIVILDKGRLRQLASDVSDFDYWSWM
jgi:hypothetical protein